MNQPLVIIHCLVYNHEPYLRDCLEGFVMQKTNFPFYAVVHDDCSTDNSAAIIREYAEKYPDIIHPIYETENQYSKKDGSLERIMYEACKPATYIAMCEGDDYWTDPLKLQKQVDIMEADSSIVLVASDTSIVDHTSKEIQASQADRLKPKFYKEKYNLDDFVACNMTVSTLTAIYRNHKPEELHQFQVHCRNRFLGDWILFTLLLRDGEYYYYMDEVTGAYRINPTSITHTTWQSEKVARVEATRDICNRVSECLPVHYRKYYKIGAWWWFSYGKVLAKDKQYLRAIGAMLRCFFMSPKTFFRDIRKLTF